MITMTNDRSITDEHVSSQVYIIIQYWIWQHIVFKIGVVWFNMLDADLDTWFSLNYRQTNKWNNAFEWMRKCFLLAMITL